MKFPFNKALCASAVALCVTAGSQTAFAAGQGISLGDDARGLSPVAPLAQFIPALSNRGIADQYIVILNSQPGPGLSTQSAADRSEMVNTMALDIAGNVNGRVTRQYSNAVNGFVVRMDASEITRLRQDPRVQLVEQDQMMSVSTTQNGATWGIDRIDQQDLPLSGTYTYTDNGAGVNAYILDTGITIAHNDFGGRAVNGWDFIDNDSVANDCHSHGTHVAGTVGSATYGVAKGATLTGVRVLDCQGSGANSVVIDGVDWVTANASLPAVANMSLGGGSSTALDNAVNGAINAGITFVVAAGNDNADACNGSPNRVPAAITVASSTSSDARSSFSNWGSCIDIFGPGSSITSTLNSTSGSSVKSGTSMASPHVAGVAAIYLQSNPSATPAQVDTAITNQATPGKISDPRGSVNLLLNMNFDGTPPPPPPPPGGGTLTNGVPVTGISGATGSQTNYTLDVPAGATNLSFDMSGGTGDADLYVRFGSAPTTSTYDCRPFLNGNNESCPISSAQTGTYHVMLVGFTAYSGVSLTGSFTAGGGGGGNFFENTSNVSIFDNTTVSSTIPVSRTGDSGSLTVSVDIKHTWVGDLTLTVFTPTGESAVVRDRTGGSANDIMESYNLTANGIESSGNWRLEVRDNASGDTGFIDSWSITFN